MDRVSVVEAALDRAVAEAPAPQQRLAPDAALRAGSSLTAARAVALFEDMVRSRALDVVARELKARGEGYYTISSAGHEHTAVVGALTRPTDPAFLHYRDGGFVAARSRLAGTDVTWDTLLSLAASREDPASQGRHKVWGSPTAWIVPQTSTIASHLPKAVGAAFAIARSRRLDAGAVAGNTLPADALVVCSFGDASLNHASALAGLNAARWARRVGSPMPILFVCEDNGIGISVQTPPGWVEATAAALPGCTYVRAEGELDAVWDAVEHAVTAVRSRRAPVFLHLPTVRLWGHAGSDLEAAYRSREDIEAAEAADPLAHAARLLIATGAASTGQLQELIARVRAETRDRAGAAVSTGPLRTADEVVAPLAPHTPEAVRRDAARTVDVAARRSAHGRRLPEHAVTAGERTLAGLLNAALRDELARRPGAVVFGEDVGRKGGVYGVTAGLQATFGTGRVFDTLLDETSILGLAQGLGLLGLIPIPEIQYLAYVHNALDQLRGEACSTQFFSAGHYRTPMVVRIAGLAYQKGFGGHFHNDNAVGALRDIPGLLLAVPSRGDDAVRMLRGCLAMAEVDGRVCTFLEPIALYHERDLHDPGDGGWLSDYPPLDEVLLPGEVGVHHPEADDVLLVTYGNGVRMSLRAARRLADHGIGARVLDLRWLSPLPSAAVREHAQACGRVLVVDECRRTGAGVADAVLADLAEHGFDGALASIRSHDSYVPLGPAAELVLLSEDDVVEATLALHARGRAPAPR
ncbi:thiamine pyrophosphate-dependent enzyme [Egicoccus sp. AB-alg2]|uniref:thiamine pyrophosphate-dependent enzyme n=1 Tax=Egicoccus sp. AB-alg2 TaxID=3242693 RepID=UPI00359E3C21